MFPQGGNETDLSNFTFQSSLQNTETRYFVLCGILIITLSFVHVCLDTHVLLEIWPFFSVVAFRASYYVFMSIRLHGRPGVKILGDEKRYRTETINTYSLKKSNLKIHCNVI